METKSERGLEEYLSNLTSEVRARVWAVLKQKKPKRSHYEPNGELNKIPHKTCDNCAYTSLEQPSNDPYQLVESCPHFNERMFNEEINRMVCSWCTNRRYEMRSFEKETADGDGVEEG